MRRERIFYVVLTIYIILDIHQKQGRTLHLQLTTLRLLTWWIRNLNFITCIMHLHSWLASNPPTSLCLHLVIQKEEGYQNSLPLYWTWEWTSSDTAKHNVIENQKNKHKHENPISYFSDI